MYSKNRYSDIGINSLKSFENYLISKNLNFQNIREKFYIEIIWNDFIFQKFKEKVIIDKEKMFTSDKGNLCIFDPAGMHRGGICNKGTRIALQILMKWDQTKK